MRRILLIITIFAGICSAISFAGISFINETGDPLGDSGCLGDEPYSTTVIEQMGYITLPASAQNVEATSGGFQECFIYISFEMSPDDLDALLNSSYIEAVNPTSSDALDTFASWMAVNDVNWNLSEDVTYLYGAGDNGISQNQAIVIDTSDAEQYKVYIITALF